MKGSLNTFLNAFTYPDRTCYPVASTNAQVRQQQHQHQQHQQQKQQQVDCAIQYSAVLQLGTGPNLGACMLKARASTEQLREQGSAVKDDSRTVAKI